MPSQVKDAGAWLRETWSVPSRPACWLCGLKEGATIHGSKTFWQHEYTPAILTRSR